MRFDPCKQIAVHLFFVELIQDLPDALEAPIRAGDPVGTAMLRSNGQVLAQCRLVAAESVQRRLSLPQSFIRLLRRWVLQFRT